MEGDVKNIVSSKKMKTTPKLEEYKKAYANDRFFNEVFKNEIYKDVINKKKDIVVDVGALAGEFSFWISPDAGVVYAIEPEAEEFKELEQNIVNYGFDKVKPFNIALAGTNKTRNLHLQGRGGHLLMGTEGGQEVQTKTLATFMKENNIPYVDILKIDVEGGEDEIFKAEDFKEVADKIGCIVGEHLETVEATLHSLGFSSVSIHERNLLLERIKE